MAVFVLTAAQDHRVKSGVRSKQIHSPSRHSSENLALNGHPVVVYPFALSDTAERKTLIHGPENDTGMSTLSQLAHRYDEPSLSVRAAAHVRDRLPHRGDLMAHMAVPPPTLMKIDV